MVNYKNPHLEKESLVYVRIPLTKYSRNVFYANEWSDNRERDDRKIDRSKYKGNNKIRERN